MISAMSASNDAAASAALNKIARPNDLGLSALGLKVVSEEKESKKSFPMPGY